MTVRTGTTLGRLRDELAGLGGDVVGDPDAPVTAMTHDSRHATPGTLYACVRGDRHDGHEFAPAAVAAGATALLVDHRLELAVPQLVVSDTRAAMGPVAAAVYDHPSTALSVVGITGTNGKTTTAHLLGVDPSRGGPPDRHDRHPFRDPHHAGGPRAAGSAWPRTATTATRPS